MALTTKALPANFQKAELAIENGEVVKCLFNPTEYTITKTNTWNYDPVTGSSLPEAKFGGGAPRELSLSLLLDVSLLAPNQSVDGITNKLFDMMQVPDGQSAGNASAVPPLITFRWGGVITFKAVCTSLTVAFQLFHPNGKPIRADVKLSLKEAGSATKGQNPTTRATVSQKVHRVRDGDSLPSIAYDAYGDATSWRLIAEANGIDNPMLLRRGTPLSVPRLGEG
jgi:hypothetical protein